MKKQMPEYCRECGLPLEYSVERADKIKIDHYNFGGVTTSRLASAFNKYTGEENFAHLYTCPNWRTYWFWGSNAHDKIVNYDNDLHFL